MNRNLAEDSRYRAPVLMIEPDAVPLQSPVYRIAPYDSISLRTPKLRHDLSITPALRGGEAGP